LEKSTNNKFRKVFMKYTPYTLDGVNKASAQNKFNVISTFAGGGGSSTGYRLGGGKILCINEFVEEARNTYHENYPETPIIPDDIKKLTGKDFLKASGLDVGELDILDGSPPCSAFSMAGSVSHNKVQETVTDLFGNEQEYKVSGKHSDGWKSTKNYSDGKKVENIEDLFFEFLRVAKEIQPKVIIGENVTGLTMGEAKEYFNKILKEFENIGYDVSAQILNSVNFGVPQTRRRVIFIAVRQDVTSAVGLTFLNIASIFPEGNNDVISLGEAFEGLEYDQEEVDYLIKRWTASAHYKDTVALMPKDPKKVLTGADYHPKGHHFNVKRCSRFKPAPTLTATGAAETGAGGCHWSEPRKFTIAELKRMTSLPDDFILTGKHSQKAERCGRMVPPLMMKAVAEAVYTNILEKYNG
jgi:DNA (cytosine-5)-methyltransferase 1